MKAMSDLKVCEECQRHIKVSESACPFCGDSAGRGPSRAALFAGALVSATALGCGDSKPAVEGPDNSGGGVQAVEIDAMAASPVDTEEVVEEPKEEVIEEPPPPMPYGAPPARKRFV
jgi:hypothetical protein